MFGIGSTEFLVILLVALMVLGPKSLAGIARTAGKYMGEFRRMSTDFQRTLNAEVAQEEESERKKKTAPAAPSESAVSQPDDKTDAATAAPVEPVEPVESVAPVMPIIEDRTDEAPTAGLPEPPPGSPLAEALIKTGAAAEAAEKNPTPPDAGKGATA